MVPPQRGQQLAELLQPWGVKLTDTVVVDQVVRLFQGPALGLQILASTYGTHPVTQGLQPSAPCSRWCAPCRPTPPARPASARSSSSSRARRRGARATSRACSSAARPRRSDDRHQRTGLARRRRHRQAQGDGLRQRGRDQAHRRRRRRLRVEPVLRTALQPRPRPQHDGLARRPGRADLDPAARHRGVARPALARTRARRIFYLSVLVLPELLLFLGLTVWWRRSTK